MKTFVTLVCILIAVTSYTQDWQPIELPAMQHRMEELSTYFRRPDYQLSYRKEVYMNSSDTNVISKDNGMFARGEGKAYRSETKDQLVVQTNTVKMVVNYTDSSIFILPADTLFNPLNIAGMMSLDSWNDYRYEQLKTARESRLRISRKTPAPGVDVTEIWFFKASSNIQKVIIRLTPGNYYMESMDDKTKESPKIIVTYSLPEKVSSTNLFSISDWVVPAGTTYELTPSKKGIFRMEDIRYHR